MTNSQRVNFLAPAKINLFLYVLYKREDGYHEIKSLIVPVSLFDFVSITKIKRGIEVVCNGRFPVPGGKGNIAFKAAELFIDHFSLTGGVEIYIDKKIPSGAGLGGGSSDAAAVLKGMSLLFLGEIQSETLRNLSSKIGSDVPFFIYPVPSIVSGRGDVIRKIAFGKKFHILILKPRVSVDTHLAYQMLDRLHGPVDCEPHLSENIESLEVLRECQHNDFEDVVFRMYPEVKELKWRLLGLGAGSALLSGSGSSVYGIFERKEGAERAKEEFGAEEGIFAELVENF